MIKICKILLIILYIFIIINVNYGLQCTRQNYSHGYWIKKAKGYEAYVLYPKIKSFHCKNFGDKRIHEKYEWKTKRHTNCPMIDLHDTLLLNQCFKNLTVTFIGDSHYRYAGETMKYLCLKRKCSFTINVINDFFLVNTTNFQVTSQFKQAVNTSDVLIMGTGHHYSPDKPAFAIYNYTWDMIKIDTIKSINSILDYLNKNFHGKAIVWMSYTPRHFSGGDFFNNGTCLYPDDIPLKTSLITLSEINYIITWNNVNNYIDNYKSRIKNLFIVDVTNMSLLRPGAHLSIYHKINKTTDCSHYCIPGVPDEWNRLTMTMLCHPHSSYYHLLNPILTSLNTTSKLL